MSHKLSDLTIASSQHHNSNVTNPLIYQPSFSSSNSKVWTIPICFSGLSTAPIGVNQQKEINQREIENHLMERLLICHVALPDHSSSEKC